MQVFTEFIKQDLTEDQILPVLRDLLPVLLSILGDHEVRQCTLSRSRTNEPDLNTLFFLATHATDTLTYHRGLQPMRRGSIHG